MDSSTTPAHIPQQWFKPEEYADLNLVSLSTVYELLRQDKIPHKRIGKQIRIPRSAVMPQELATV